MVGWASESNGPVNGPTGGAVWSGSRGGSAEAAVVAKGDGEGLGGAERWGRGVVGGLVGTAGAVR